MVQRLHVSVSVALVFNHMLRKTIPRWVIWEGRTYEIIKLGLHHTFRVGRTLYHAFSVESPALFLKLVLNTDNLSWTLEEISDGEPN